MMENSVVMNIPFSAEAWETFLSGVRIMVIGMTTVIGVLFLFYLLVKLMIKVFPEKE